MDVVGYRNAKEFENLFIFQGMSLFELSKFFSIDWTTADAWRKRHGLPKHTEPEEIIRRYGEEVLAGIVARKSASYAVSNKAKAHRDKTIEEIYGPERAKQVRQRMSEGLKGVKRTAEFKANLALKRRGLHNPNFKGGYYSVLHKEINRSIVWQFSAALFNGRVVIERRFTCEECGTKSFGCHGHHMLPFSQIFGTICEYAARTGNLNTEWVATEIYRFHDTHRDEIYKCLCEYCHTDAHMKENSDKVMADWDRLRHLLEPYHANPDPSSTEGGAETIESTESGTHGGEHLG